MYATPANITDAVPAIGSLTNVTSAIITGFIGQAEAIMNSRLASQYPMPLPSSSGITYPMLTVLSIDMTVYRLLSRRVFTSEKINKSAWMDKFSEANSLLFELATGRMPLLDSNGNQVAKSAAFSVWSNTSNYQPTFDVGDPLNQNVDPNHIDDLADLKD